MKKPKNAAKTAALSLGELGVVYCDIGTSPIYAFNESVNAGGTSRPAILGVLSLVFWTLMLVVTIKYLLIVLRADNRGEEIVFDTLHRNASTASRYYKLPAHRVITFNVAVEI